MTFRWLRGLAILALLMAACSGASVTAGTAEGAPPEESDTTMSRDDAVQLLINDAFLAPDAAACVVDGVYTSTASHDPNTAEAQAAIVSEDLVAACTAPAGETDGEPVEETGDDETDAGSAAQTLSLVPPFELTDASMPALNPGGLATGTVVIGGKTIEYVTVTPDGFTLGDTAPLFLALPPGGQDLTITRNVVNTVYQEQALLRGWVVVSPATPGGRWFEPENTAVIPEFLSWMQAWVDAENAKPHIGGMSNGGLSAFHIALQDPSRFQSLLAFPGFPPTEADSAAISQLSDLPVRMWVGGEDTRWLARMITAETSLIDAGGNVQLWVLPGEPHVLSSTRDGVAFFDELDDARRG